MATRFGAVSPAQTYATKVRWLVGCLVSVILVLLVAIIFIAQGSDASEDVAPPVAEQVVEESPTRNVNVLVAAVRIEQGAQLAPTMFKAVSMDEDRMPMGVIGEADQGQIIGKFAKRLVNANMPLVMEDISEVPPLNTFSIPPGYRAATITVDARTGVEGFAKPNSRVDILWAYTNKGRQNVATIARFVKILSVQGITRTDSNRVAVNKGSTTVTVLVTERDAKKIELARTLGSLSLSLVGDEETTTPTNEPDAITIADLIGRPATSTEPAEVANDGVMYTSDPRTGRQLRYVLRSGRWSLDRGFGGE